MCYDTSMTQDILKFLNDNYGACVTIIVLIVAIVVSVKVCVSFDLNKWMQQRKQRHLTLAQGLCPHFELIPDEKNGRIIIKPLLASPSGTIKYYCQKCGVVVPVVDHERIANTANDYIQRPTAYVKIINKVDRHLKKSA